MSTQKKKELSEDGSCILVNVDHRNKTEEVEDSLIFLAAQQ